MHMRAAQVEHFDVVSHNNDGAKHTTPFVHYVHTCEGVNAGGGVGFRRTVVRFDLCRLSQHLHVTHTHTHVCRSYARFLQTPIESNVDVDNVNKIKRLIEAISMFTFFL